MLAEFDGSTPSWVILLIESIFIIMLKSYNHNPYGTSSFDNGSVNRVMTYFQTGLVVQLILPFKASTGPSQFGRGRFDD